MSFKRHLTLLLTLTGCCSNILRYFLPLKTLFYYLLTSFLLVERMVFERMGGHLLNRIIRMCDSQSFLKREQVKPKNDNQYKANQSTNMSLSFISRFDEIQTMVEQCRQNDNKGKNALHVCGLFMELR